MRQALPRIPQDRIAVLIGAKGVTLKALAEASGAVALHVDSESGDVEVEWGEPGSYDPVRALKMPDVVKAIGRGMAPKVAVSLFDDGWYFEMVDLRDHVGKRAKQLQRIRARIIGSQGKIRQRIEQITGSSITIYKSTVVIIAEEEGLALARQAVDMLAGGAEHGSVMSFLERATKRNRIERRQLGSIEVRDQGDAEATGFESLVPGLDQARERRNRRFRAAQVDPEDDEAVEAMMGLADDESISWDEEE